MSPLNDEQIRLCHRLHTERSIPIIEIARSNWQKYGYASADSLSYSLRQAFKKRGLAATPAVKALAPFQFKKADEPAEPEAPAAPEAPRDEWVQVDRLTWRNPATGGVAQVAACGWCGRGVVWPVEGHDHSFGVCVDRAAAIERMRPLMEKRNPSFVVQDAWDRIVGSASSEGRS